MSPFRGAPGVSQSHDDAPRDLRRVEGSPIDLDPCVGKERSVVAGSYADDHLRRGHARGNGEGAAEARPKAAHGAREPASFLGRLDGREESADAHQDGVRPCWRVRSYEAPGRCVKRKVAERGQERRHT